MINTGGLVNSTRTRETCFEAGVTVSDFSFQSYLIDRSVSANPSSNPTFGFRIDHALSKSINDPQLDRPTQSLDGDRPSFTTRTTRAKSYTLPDSMLKQTNVKQGFINPEHIEIPGQRTPSLPPTAVRPDKRLIESPLSIFV